MKQTENEEKIRGTKTLVKV